MSLYQLQKLLFDVNRDGQVRSRFLADHRDVLGAYDLTAEEANAVLRDDIGLLYILGVNGQILLQFATWLGFGWDAYIAALKTALAAHGQVRAGLYAAAHPGSKQC